MGRIKYITTVAKARQLPELDVEEYRTAVRTRTLPLDPVGVSGDHLLAFQDTDGTTKEPIWFKGKWWKAEWGTSTIL